MNKFLSLTLSSIIIFSGLSVSANYSSFAETALSGQNSKSKLEHKVINRLENEIHIIIIPKSYKIIPVTKRPGKTVRDYVVSEKALAGINAGYFNHSDGYPVSFVVINGKPQEDPRKNKALINNPALKTLLPKIFYNRSEFREVIKNSEKSWVITQHSMIPETGSIINNSVQAGPNLLPSPSLEEEGFIIKNSKGLVTRDGIGSQSKAARSAIGIDKNNNIVFITVSSKGKGHGMTITELSNLAKELNLISAMAFDGGSSTTLTWKENNQYKTFTGSSNYPALVNSALLVFEK